MKSDVITKIKRKRITELLSSDQRIDKRGLTEYREITFDTNLVEKAAGSAMVSIGNSKVIVGIKIEVGTPFTDKPDQGVLTTNVELTPLAHSNFEPGPPSVDSIELARVVDRGIRESKAIDLKKLCIVPTKKVFVVFVDIFVLNHDGNLFDTSALASMLALMNAKMTKYKVTNDEKLEFESGYVKLPIQSHPVTVTVARINDKLVIDPSIDEEQVADVQVTIAIDENNHICAIQKRGSGFISIGDTLNIFKIAREKSEEIRKKIMGNGFEKEEEN